MDLTEAEFVAADNGTGPKKNTLTILSPDDSETIYNVIILEKDKENNKNGE
ncbi:MAG: hypothetical protein IJJ76_06080 [Ruminococcus sp.]|uniref:hypothetical protein n=1 Tax=Ruminococcus sp. TaxID=41978 RepID=UPI0025F4F101|nr:hypothetical protein [Ruminococcus sp.]MBQ9542778.1 hypothetical protein [Ruminococcus sp.]MBR0529322.1 hypothetical protein [Ruminococcus sp.]